MDVVSELARLFEAAKVAHLEAFAHVDGTDPEWPLWYARFLRRDLATVLGTDLSEEQIAELLEGLAERHQLDAPDRDWFLYYAEATAAAYGT